MKHKSLLWLLLIIFAVIVTYSNHFNNPFHFDDTHTIENNLYIRSLKNVPLFFKDVATFSSLPTNQSYRPIVTASLALDYHLAGGLNPFYFHLSMFFWYVIQLVLMFFFFRKIMHFAVQHKWTDYFALFAVAWYGLHTVNAETLNYIISRSDSLSTLCVLAAMYFYAAFPKKQKYHLYLFPVVIGMLVKEQTAMFAPLLFFYILLFESQMSLKGIFLKKNLGLFKKAIYKSLPAFTVCLAMGILVFNMKSDDFTPAGTSSFHFFITQPWVYLRYLIAFFLPFNLSADTDWVAFENIFDERVIIGFSFMLLLAFTIFKTSEKKETRPIAFGLLWFFVSLLPTSSIIPLTITNDHRMFFPFVGLVLAVVWAIALIIQKHESVIVKKQLYRFGLIAGCVLLLAAHAYGVRQRNKVWQTHESLWYDVTLKSPNNSRGLMNYGLSQMSKGNLGVALNYFNRALVLTPNYTYLHVNLAIVKNAMGRVKEAEEHYLKAVYLGNNINVTHFYYAQFLFKENRINEALSYAEQALILSPADIKTRHLLMQIYSNLKMGVKLDNIINETLSIYPNDSYTQAFKSIDFSKHLSPIELAEEQASKHPSADNYLNLSLTYYNHGMYEKCIEACYEALKVAPDFAEAYNNICSAYIALHEWDKAIEACEKALALKPEFERATNNRNWALQQKAQEK